MSQFYHDLITEKSWQLLVELKKSYRFVLIGGWAVFLYTNSLKSKDIDIIIDYDELGRFKDQFTLLKNDRLKKYEIKAGNFDVDIYLPHYSDLGVDIKRVQETSVIRQGFGVPNLEILFMLKLYAWHNRRGSTKGQKDELDIFSLVFMPEFSWLSLSNLIKEYGFEKFYKSFFALIKQTSEIKELGVNAQAMSKFKKKLPPDFLTVLRAGS